MKTMIGQHGLETKKRHAVSQRVLNSSANTLGQNRTLINADSRNREHLDTFWIPPAQVRETLVVGDAVKLSFEYGRSHSIVLPDGDASINGERMWVRVTEVRLVESEAEGDRTLVAYSGVLGNKPLVSRYLKRCSACGLQRLACLISALPAPTMIRRRLAGRAAGPDGVRPSNEAGGWFAGPRGGCNARQVRRALSPT